jgi:L-fucose mutarotase
MLKYPLIHPPLLGALAGTGHGSRILLADANYAYATNVRRKAPVIYLNLRPGLVLVDDVLDLICGAVAVEEAFGMRPDGGGEPDALPRYAQILGPAVPLRLLSRPDFYAAGRGFDVAFAVATADQRLYANLLLTVGFTVPGR